MLHAATKSMALQNGDSSIERWTLHISFCLAEAMMDRFNPPAWTSVSLDHRSIVAPWQLAISGKPYARLHYYAARAGN